MHLGAVMQLYATDPAFLPAIGPCWAGMKIKRRNFTGLLSAHDPNIAAQHQAWELGRSRR